MSLAIRIICLFLLWSLASYKVFAQNQSAVDSMLNVLKTSISDKEAVDTYVKLAEEYRKLDSVKTYEYTHQAIQLAEKINYPEGKIDAWYAQGFMNVILGNYQKSEVLFQQMIEESEQSKYAKGKGNGYNGLGNVSLRQGNYNKALEYYLKALKIREESGDNQEIASSYNNIGAIYYSQGDNDKALEYYLRALKIKEELGNKQSLTGSYNNIGVIYYKQGKKDKALEYYLKALKIQEESGDIKGVANSYNNIGAVYYEEGNSDKALEYYLKALEIREELGNKQSLTGSYNNIGVIYRRQGNNDKALEYHVKALKIRKELGDKQGIAESYNNIRIAYAGQGNYKDAYKYHVLYKEMSDSLFNEEQTKEFTRLELNYKFEQERDSIQIANQSKQALLEKDIENRRLTQIATFIGLGFSLVLVAVLIVFFRDQKRNNQKLNQANEEIQTVNEALKVTLETVQHQKDQILASINYAQRIQQAILPSMEKIEQLLPDSFIFFKPRDIVSGDFYYVRKLGNNKIIVAAVDCTGHGVPGAFMSLISYLVLNVLTVLMRISSASELLEQLHISIRQILHQKETKTNDGMDIALVVIDKEKKTLEFAGAKNPLIYIQNGELHQIKGDRMSIGGERKEEQKQGFTAHKIDISKPTTFYLFSDGFQDQFGGENVRKFMIKRFRSLLFDIHEQPMPEQKNTLETTLQNWMGDQRQIDDILVIGGSIA